MPALLVEKPLAIDGQGYADIRQWADRAPAVKVAVNHQLHFHPQRMLMQDRVLAGDIGEVRFLDASASLAVVSTTDAAQTDPIVLRRSADTRSSWPLLVV